MLLATINSGRLWADQLSALSAQRAAAPNALTAPGSSPLSATVAGGGAGLFAGLLSTLTGNAAATGSTASSTNAGASSTSNASRAQIAQDLRAFTQSLLQALATNQYAPTPSGSSGSASGAANHVNFGSSTIGAESTRGYGHGQGNGGMRGKLGSPIHTLSNNSSTSTSNASSSAHATTLNTGFDKLMTDLGLRTSPAGPFGTTTSGSASNVAPDQTAAMTLKSLQQGMLQHVQQQRSWAASGDHVVHVTA